MAKQLSPALLDEVAARLRLLGDSTRLAILQELLDGGELSVGEVAERLDAGHANVSKHLRLLYEAGVVARRKQGTEARYSVLDPSVEQLCDIVCGRLQLEAEARAKVFAGLTIGRPER